MLHPVLIKYADLQKREFGWKMSVEALAERAKGIIESSFNDPPGIDGVDWVVMARAIDDPKIDIENFAQVYEEEDWCNNRYLEQTLYRIVRPIPDKSLEDYL